MKLLMIILCLMLLRTPVSALEIEAPMVPESGKQWMPENTDSFAEGVQELMENILSTIHPDLKEASGVSVKIIAVVLAISLLQSFSSSTAVVTEGAGCIAICSLLLHSTNSLIQLASDTVHEIGEYNKLLLPVMTAGLAAQGNISTSSALYVGTTAFSALLQSIMSSLFVPGIYIYIALQTGSSATGEVLLRKTGDLLKSCISWFLKILLMLFTTYLSLTGVVSGTTDAAALKAAKVTMSTFVPVVGNILSDASEAVLVSAGLVKNAAGIYGILAVLAVFLYPFLKIGIHYLILKLSAAICGVFGGSRVTCTIEAFSTAMGLLLGMTAAACVMVLISTVCFLKGAG